jgi:hypothetical protein
MSSKVSVILLKSRAVDTSSDMNKMAVHLEQMLAEKDGVDLKIRQGLTDASIKSADFVIFCGYDSACLSEFFKALSAIEEMPGKEGPVLFLYEEAGQSIWEHLNYILSAGMGLGRITPKVFDKIVSVWSYRDIITTIDIRVRQLGIDSADGDSTATKRGNAPKASGARPVEA